MGVCVYRKVGAPHNFSTNKTKQQPQKETNSYILFCSGGVDKRNKNVCNWCAGNENWCQQRRNIITAGIELTLLRFLFFGFILFRFNLPFSNRCFRFPNLRHYWHSYAFSLNIPFCNVIGMWKQLGYSDEFPPAPLCVVACHETLSVSFLLYAHTGHIFSSTSKHKALQLFIYWTTFQRKNDDSVISEVFSLHCTVLTTLSTLAIQKLHPNVFTHTIIC